MAFYFTSCAYVVIYEREGEANIFYPAVAQQPRVAGVA